MTAAPGPQQPDEERCAPACYSMGSSVWHAEGCAILAAHVEDDPCEDGCDPAFVQQDTVDSDLCSRCGRRGVMGDD